MTLLMLGSPIRKSPDHSLLTATRSLSQSSTSFIGNIRLGIHLVPLSTFLCIDLTSNCYPQMIIYPSELIARYYLAGISATAMQSLAVNLSFTSLNC